ncbi:hypothetical protein HGRIS_011446 [Hohenbuehelia grisea]|uniref:Lipid droplet-associated perilipin protein n=1 Tax=Hohenbuehelia grisea TaxID=104357 RepID=A0ABR3JXB9_9AGAR
MATETQTSTIPMPTNGSAKPAPELTFLNRMASIPLISSSLQTIDDTLASNTYTKASYSTAKDISVSAYKYAEPIQVRLQVTLAPLFVRADGYANKAADIVESRYPYPFKASPEEVVTYVRERRDSAVSVANKTLDERVKSPAYNVAQGIDHRFAPIVDYLEVAVHRFNGSAEAGPSTPPDAKYQYQRALALSRTLKDNVYVYSNDQLKHVQAQSVLVQRATETTQAISILASSSLQSAQTRIQALSDTMLVELQKIQAQTHALSASVSSSVTASAADLQASVKSRTQIPPHLQEVIHDFQTGLSSTIAEFQGIVTAKDVPVQDKVARIGTEVRERVGPLLENIQKRISDVIGGQKKPTVNGVNGNGNGNGVANGHASE